MDITARTPDGSDWRPVLFMTPGLALFYAGYGPRRNVR